MVRQVDSTVNGNDRDESGPSGPYEPVPVIMVIGKTGSGKSSFVHILGGRDFDTHNPPVISRKLDSCTNTATVYKTTIQNRMVYLLDTPGFDDSARDNLAILNDIVSHLWTLVVQKAFFRIQGVVFLHDISENRLGGSQRKTWEILKALCGGDGLKNVIVGTTRWSTDPFTAIDEEDREKELLSEHWKGIHGTMRVPRADKESAYKIIEKVLALPPVVLRAQREMMKPPHTVENTTAGKIALPEGYTEAKRLEQEMEELKRQHEELRESEEILRIQFEEENARQIEEHRRQLEEKFQKQEEARQKQEEERQRQEEARQKKEEERQKLEEERRIKEEENLRLQEERRRKMEEENLRLQEERRRKMEEDYTKLFEQRAIQLEREYKFRKEKLRQEQEAVRKEKENNKKEYDGLQEQLRKTKSGWNFFSMCSIQ